MNPFRTALLTVGGLALLIGGLMFIGGTFINPFDGAWAAVIGSGLFGLGAQAILLWLVVAALTYSPDGAKGPSVKELGDAFRDGLSRRGE